MLKICLKRPARFADIFPHPPPPAKRAVMSSSAPFLSAAEPRRRAARGLLLLVISAVAFSAAGFFTREAPVNLWAMVFWRNLFGSAALAPFLFASRNPMSLRSILLLGRGR